MEDLKPSPAKASEGCIPFHGGILAVEGASQEVSKEYPDIELELSDLGTMDIVTLLKQEELEVGYGQLTHS